MKWNKRDRWPSIYLFDIQICIFTMYHTHILTDILWQKCHLSRLMLIYVWQEQSAETLTVNLLIFFNFFLLHLLQSTEWHKASHVRVTMRVLFWFFRSYLRWPIYSEIYGWSVIFGITCYLPFLLTETYPTYGWCYKFLFLQLTWHLHTLFCWLVEYFMWHEWCQGMCCWKWGIWYCRFQFLRKFWPMNVYLRKFLGATFGIELDLNKTQSYPWMI